MAFAIGPLLDIVETPVSFVLMHWVPKIGIFAWLSSSEPSSLCHAVLTSKGHPGGGWGGWCVGGSIYFCPHRLITLHFLAFKCSCHLRPIHLNSFPHSSSYPMYTPPDVLCLFALFSKELGNSTFSFILFPADLNTHFHLLWKRSQGWVLPVS